MCNLTGIAVWRPSASHLAAAGLFIAGLLLTSVSWWFLLLTAAGMFGPGVMRELGWLHDQDEFQRAAAYRAGYHAFLVTGILAIFLVVFFRSSPVPIAATQELATLFLGVLGLSWLLSSLIGYWGIKKAATRTLLAFGSAWLVFAILSNVGTEWSGWTALLLQPLLASPFLVLAWVTQRWPRVAGIALLVVSAWLTYFLGFFRNEHIALINQAVTFVLFVGPLLGVGVSLTLAQRDSINDNGSAE
ncbi:MAG: hypothetical protein KDA83_14915 [Planctomycetales bacterium]|nr:hypothetical protein [Planctomycetales bacterium]